MVDKRRGSGIIEGLPKGVALLNEFVAVCLHSAQGRLRREGIGEGIVSFGYNMKGDFEEPGISHYELNHQTTDRADEETERVRSYARSTGAEAVSIAVDLGSDPDVVALFPGADGVLMVAAVSQGAEVCIMRPYAHSREGIAFGEPKISEGHRLPLLDALYDRTPEIRRQED